VSVTRFCRERLITLISNAASGFGRIVSASFSVPAGSIAANGAKPSAMTQAVSILTRIHTPDILRHLVALPAEDRWLRFGHSISPAALKYYVHEIDLSRDQALGVYDPDHALIGFTHIAVDQPSGCAELGISVLPEHRRRSLGVAMLRRALQHAADLGLDRVCAHFRAENLPVLKLARKAGFYVATHGCEGLASKQIAGSVLPLSPFARQPARIFIKPE